jgi:hypothetical protein
VRWHNNKPDKGYVVVASEKHGDVYYRAATFYEFQQACARILRERVEAGYWYDDEDEAEARNALEHAESDLVAKNGTWRTTPAARFLASRSEHEYERVDLIPLL